jgi:hypothetical protein
MFKFIEHSWDYNYLNIILYVMLNSHKISRYQGQYIDKL